MAPQTLDSPTLLTPRQAAAALAISQRKLWSLTSSGEVKCCRIGRAVRYDTADLTDFVAASKQHSR